VQATIKILFTIILFLFTINSVCAQTVKGTVIDNDTNEVLPGASVVQKGTDRGTSTNADGSFTLDLLPDNEAVLTVSFVGYEQRDFQIKDVNKTVTIELTPITIRGDEVFVEDVRADENEPITQSTINRVQIEQDNIGQDPIFTLEKLTPSILTHSDSGTRFANYSYMRLRGMDQTRINMTLNGIPLNDMIDQGVFFSNFNDFGNSIQSAQVQRGVGTSTNGTASYAGSVNFESQNITMDTPSVNAKATGGSFNSHRLSAELNTGSMKNFGFFTRFSKTVSDGYRFNSGTESTSFFASGGYFGKNNIVKITAFNGRTKNELAYTPVSIDLIREEPRTNTVSENDEDDFGQQFLQLQFNRTIKNGVSLNSSVYYGGAGGDFPVGFNGANGEFIQQIFSLENDHYGFKSSLNYNDGSGLELSGGIHAYRFDRINEESFAPESETVFYSDDSQKDEFSAFTKINYKIGNVELYGDLQIRTLSLALEPDISFLLDAGVPRSETNVPTRKWTFVSPKAGITYHLNQNLNIYGSFGRSGREPTRQDILGATNINPANIDVVKNRSSVMAEYVNDFEAGFRFATEKLSGKVNGFFMQFSNEISPTGEFIPEGFVQLRENISNSRRTGIELEWNWSALQKLSFSGNTTWMTTNIDEFSPAGTDEVFRDVESILSPNWLANAMITYRVFERADISFSGRYMGEAFLELTNNPEFVMPSFFKADIGLDVRINSYLSANLKVNNIFDKLYFTNGAPLDTNFDGSFDTPGFIVQPPRHAFIEVKVDI